VPVWVILVPERRTPRKPPSGPLIGTTKLRRREMAQGRATPRDSSARALGRLGPGGSFNRCGLSQWVPHRMTSYHSGDTTPLQE
jgi:hypothetical protein